MKTKNPFRIIVSVILTVVVVVLFTVNEFAVRFALTIE
jgi:hypothetical protein